MDRIKNWFRSLGSKMQSFMYGRYGYDELSQFLSKTALLCVIVGLFAYPGFSAASQWRCIWLPCSECTPKIL